MTNYGIDALVSILSHLIFITITWWALQSLNYEKIFKKNRVIQARTLFILITIAIGSTISNFFLDYLFWSKQITTLFS
ncbi:DUF1146 family protein [Cytobacillus sp. IB215665]|uniref:DUF1146 family protein n=1 Tax=Cytobacillus sp. IB215665 TaxID=3097357 RepID=UPI002A1449D0|nr:DUF1146 family protein [Cytobacillus sp. IB215665]MDX8363715.1 DUF1146 family protein [Cytobacillus sp. IB215665]